MQSNEKFENNLQNAAENSNNKNNNSDNNINHNNGSVIATNMNGNSIIDHISIRSLKRNNNNDNDDNDESSSSYCDNNNNNNNYIDDSSEIVTDSDEQETNHSTIQIFSPHPSRRHDNDDDNEILYITNQQLNLSKMGTNIGVTTSNGDNEVNSLSENVKITNLAVHHSNDVTIGNKTVYNGPVVINQFLPDSLNENNENDLRNKNNKGSDNNHKNNEFSVFQLFNPSSYSQKFSKRSIIIFGLTFATIIILIITGIALSLLIKPANDNDEVTPDWSIRIIKRDEWGAKPPYTELYPFKNIPYRAIIAHTVTEGCLTESSCVLRMKFIQTIMQNGGYNDIGYNFLVGGNGLVYEGCGWDKVGIHTKGFNNHSIGIGFIGTFSKIKPTEKQLIAAKWILNECVKANKLKQNYKLNGARQLIPTESPGDVLYDLITKWPHWTDDV